MKWFFRLYKEEVWRIIADFFFVVGVVIDMIYYFAGNGRQTRTSWYPVLMAFLLAVFLCLLVRDIIKLCRERKRELSNQGKTDSER